MPESAFLPPSPPLAPVGALPAAVPHPAVCEAVAVSALLMVAGSALFVTLAALVKLAADEATAMQAVLYRSVFSALPIFGAMRRRHIGLWSPRWRLLLVRAALGFLALYCYLWAVISIDLAAVLALQQMAPIFVAFLSILLLGERPAVSHYFLGALCLAGAWLVIQPGRGLVSLGAGVALLSAVFASGAYVAVRALTRTEATTRIVLWFSAVAGLLALPMALLDWHPLSLRANLLLAGAGLTAAVAQVMMTAAYRRAPAHITSAFSYATVPQAYLTGLLFWGERPNLLANAGIALIAIGGVVLVAGVRNHSARVAAGHR